MPLSPMDERYLTITGYTNALDYLERAVRFIREVTTDKAAWKWAIIALHGSLYGFAICACKGTDYHSVTNVTKRGDRRLISFNRALRACQDPQRMSLTVMSRPLVLSADEQASIRKLQESLRNRFEHYIPMVWHIEIHGMPTIAIHAFRSFVALRLRPPIISCSPASNTNASKPWFGNSISCLSGMPIHTQLQEAPRSAQES